MARRVAQTAGLRRADRPVGFARILDAELAQDAVQAALEIAALPLERRSGQGRCQQDDAEIGVLRHFALGRFDREPDAFPHGQTFAPDQRRGRLGAGNELIDGHAVAAAVAMHIAGLQRVEFGKAGVNEASGDRLGLERLGQAPSWPSRRAPGSAASRKASTTWSEMRTRETRCKPFQAGIELTSSTRKRPSGAWMMSTPA